MCVGGAVEAVLGDPFGVAVPCSWRQQLESIVLPELSCALLIWNNRCSGVSGGRERALLRRLENTRISRVREVSRGSEIPCL